MLKCVQNYKNLSCSLMSSECQCNSDLEKSLICFLLKSLKAVIKFFLSLLKVMTLDETYYVLEKYYFIYLLFYT